MAQRKRQAEEEERIGQLPVIHGPTLAPMVEVPHPAPQPKLPRMSFQFIIQNDQEIDSASRLSAVSPRSSPLSETNVAPYLLDLRQTPEDIGGSSIVPPVNAQKAPQTPEERMNAAHSRIDSAGASDTTKDILLTEATDPSGEISNKISPVNIGKKRIRINRDLNDLRQKFEIADGKETPSRVQGRRVAAVKNKGAYKEDSGAPNEAEGVAGPSSTKRIPTPKLPPYQCEYAVTCKFGQAGEPNRKIISDYFGRNKAATREITNWILFCRKHYQRGAYKSKGWPMRKLEFIEKQFDKIFTEITWWGVDPNEVRWTIRLTKRDTERLMKYLLFLEKARQDKNGPQVFEESDFEDDDEEEFDQDDEEDNEEAADEEDDEETEALVPVAKLESLADVKSPRSLKGEASDDEDTIKAEASSPRARSKYAGDRVVGYKSADNLKRKTKGKGKGVPEPKASVYFLEGVANNHVGTGKTRADCEEVIDNMRAALNEGRIVDIPTVEFVPEFTMAMKRASKAFKYSTACQRRGIEDAVDVFEASASAPKRLKLNGPKRE